MTAGVGRRRFSRLTLVAASVSVLLVGTVSGAEAQVRPLDGSDCGSMYQLSRSGKTLRVVALGSDVRAVWGKNRYGVTEVWVNSSYKGAWNTSSDASANFPVSTGTTSKTWSLLELVDDDGYEWCSGLYQE